MSPKELSWIATVRFFLLLCAVAVAQPASAYPRYKSGCNTCHGSFTANPYRPSGGVAWPNSLHTVHRNSSYMGTACGYCHKGGDGNNPYLNSSDGAGGTPGYGCIGCHGSSASGAPNGNGLLRHHAAANVTTCAGCHSNVGAAPPENTDPPYYGTASTKVSHPCNDDNGTSEDWSGDGAGLDNDGDMLVDGNDPDCQSSTCGNGTIDPGETCDPPASCPTSCNDSDACTVDTMTGSAGTCDVACSHQAITACAGGDGCCPAGCTSANDNDCSATCGNGVVDQGETCDPPASCPTSCDDGNACTTDSLTGSAQNCNAACASIPITACAGGDGCCPAGCTSANDNDCSATCGNGVVEQGETCDPPASCPTGCDDGNACTTDSLTGSAQNCNATCASTPITACAGGDGCCPAGCLVDTDSDCVDNPTSSDSCGCAATEPASLAGGMSLLAWFGWGLRRRRTSRPTR